jgi:hypothetical protein
MKLVRTIAAPLLPSLALTAALAGCAGASAGGAAGGPGGSMGRGGSGVSACQPSNCPKAVPISTSLVLAVEIDPPAGSAGVTELPSKDLNQSNGPVSLVADSLVTVTATYNASSNASVPAVANILLDIPSAIVGRPDLTFQASVSQSGAPAASVAQLSLPQGPITRMATGTLSLIPIPPSDQQSPPYSSAVTLNSSGQLVANLPTDNFSITGALLNSALKSPDTFIARAYQNGIQVSNAATTASDGSYALTLPAVVATVGNPSLTIQLAPQSSNDPEFVFGPFAVPNPAPNKISLGTVTLAPFLQQLNQYNLPVVSNDSTQTPISGALVQMQTNLGSSNSNGQPPYPGSTQFGRSATTNAQGVASFSLLPGNPTAISYTAIVTPPPGSPYATTCTALSVGIGASSPTAPSAPTIQPGATVSKRTVLSGWVEDSMGRPVPKVAVTATPGNQPVSACAGMTTTTAAPASTTTDSQGNYTLFLDPGTPGDPVIYQLDYDPPAGSYVARYTQIGLPVDDGTTEIPGDVYLQEGGLAAGMVTDSNQNPLPSATVRLFQTRCPSGDRACAMPPWLCGQAVTDATGHFQTVVWIPPTY